MVIVTVKNLMRFIIGSRFFGLESSVERIWSAHFVAYRSSER